jgi:hypothetical protein
MRYIRSKLQTFNEDRIELASISGRPGSDYHGTDAGFALGRFLEYTGSFCDSPPPSLTGSPLVFLPAPESEIGGSTDLLQSKTGSHKPTENDDTQAAEAVTVSKPKNYTEDISNLAPTVLSQRGIQDVSGKSAAESSGRILLVVRIKWPDTKRH